MNYPKVCKVIMDSLLLRNNQQVVKVVRQKPYLHFTWRIQEKYKLVIGHPTSFTVNSHSLLTQVLTPPKPYIGGLFLHRPSTALTYLTEYVSMQRQTLALSLFQQVLRGVNSPSPPWNFFISKYVIGHSILKWTTFIRIINPMKETLSSPSFYPTINRIPEIPEIHHLCLRKCVDTFSTEDKDTNSDTDTDHQV